MQPEVLTLEVDETNDGVTTPNVDKVYSRFDKFENRSLYIEGSHTPGMRDTLALYRSVPKSNGNFRGTTKTSFKITIDVEVPGVDSTTTLVVPQIFEVSASNPVGVTAAQTKALRQRGLALIDRDDVMGPLNDQGLI